VEDTEIIELFWARNEAAIRETSAKYGKLCFHIARNILSSPEDCEECVNDTYIGVWNSIPVQRPSHFPAFISRIARNLALKKHDYNTAAKRRTEAETPLDELVDCVSGRESVENEVENRLIQRALNAFLRELDRDKRDVFLCRYWYFEPIDEICAHTGYSQSKVKSMLFHTRKKLRAYLEREGVEV